MPTPRFRVAISRRHLEQLVTAANEWPTEFGGREAFQNALRELEYRLQIEADEWGESREYLPKLRIRMRCGTCHMITILYGTNEAGNTVFVKSFTVTQPKSPA